MSANTGIEVSFDLTTGNNAVGKVLRALHLESMAIRFARETRHLVATLDGIRHELSIEGKHFLPCTPGRHTLELALGDFLGKASIAERVSLQSEDIVVEQDKLTEVQFRMELGTTNLQIVLLGNHD